MAFSRSSRSRATRRRQPVTEARSRLLCGFGEALSTARGQSGPLEGEAVDEAVEDGIGGSGHLLIAAGLAYVLDTLAQGMLADYEAVAGVFLVAVALPSMIGEGWRGVWLLFTKKIED